MLKFLILWLFHGRACSWVNYLWIHKYRRNLLLRDQRLEQATIERKHNFVPMLTFCLHLHAFSEIKVLVLHVFRFMRYVFLASIDQEELTISKVPFDFLNSATLFLRNSFALSMSVASSLTHSSFNSSATSKTLSLRRLTGIGFDPRFILFWRLVTESSH